MLRTMTVLLMIGFAGSAAAQTVESFTEPFRKLDLVPAESGILRTLSVKEGDRVAKEQQIGSLDSEIQEIALRIARQNVQSRGALDSATAERDMRRTRLQRLQELRNSGHATQEELDRALADLTVAEANLQTVLEKRKIDELECERIAAMIERRLLKSPLDGVVTRVYHEQADFVGQNGGPVLTIMQLDPLCVTFSIPNTVVGSLHPGQSIALMLPESNQNASGTVDFVSPVTEAESGTVRVKLSIKNSGGQLRCGVRCVLDLDAVATP
jgi:RND family efflux transporter MFP subunit